MKILTFGHIPLWAGGSQNTGIANVIYQLAYHMSKINGVDVTIAALGLTGEVQTGKNLHILGWTKIRLTKYVLIHPYVSLKYLLYLLLIKIRYGKVVNILNFFIKGMYLRESVIKVDPEIVHLHGATSLIYSHAVPKKYKIILTLHGLIGNDAQIKNNEWLSKLEKQICRSHRFSCIYFIAHKLVNDFVNLYGHIASPVKVILNAYDEAAFHYIEHKEQDQLTLITVASICNRKGQFRVLQALCKAGVKARYICIGDDPQCLARVLECYAQENNLDFEYKGSVSPANIREWYAHADYMILPSSSEGFGLVFLESIACGVPIILPKDIPIVEETDIISDANSILLDDCSVESIVQCLPKLSTMHFEHEKVSKTIIKYSWSNIANQYIDSMTSILY